MYMKSRKFNFAFVFSSEAYPYVSVMVNKTDRGILSLYGVVTS